VDTMSEATEELSVEVLRRRMRQRNVSVAQLAQAAELYATELSGLLGGHRQMSANRRQRIERGIRRLGLDRATDPLPPAHLPSFTIHREESD